MMSLSVLEEGQALYALTSNARGDSGVGGGIGPGMDSDSASESKVDSSSKSEKISEISFKKRNSSISSSIMSFWK